MNQKIKYAYDTRVLGYIMLFSKSSTLTSNGVLLGHVPYNMRHGTAWGYSRTVLPRIDNRTSLYVVSKSWFGWIKRLLLLNLLYSILQS